MRVAESMTCLGPWGAFNGIMVGTATEPAVIFYNGEWIFRMSKRSLSRVIISTRSLCFLKVALRSFRLEKIDEMCDKQF